MERVRAVIMLAIGVALLGAALASALSVRRFTRESSLADGRVIKLNAGGSHPEIMFTTRGGERVSYPQGGLIAGYSVGDAVRVRYREADPKRSATLDTFGALFFWPVLLVVLGGGLAVASAIALAAARRS